jgi:hypothetical protein
LDFNTRGVKTLTLIAANNIIINGQIFDSDTTNTPGDGLSLVFNAGGAVALNQSISTRGFDLTVTANGAITDSGNLNVGRDTRLNANGNDITLNNANDFSFFAFSNSRNVTLNDSNGIILGGSSILGMAGISSISGNLFVTATLNSLTTNLNANIATANQNITIAGNTNLGNSVVLNTNSGAGNINLKLINPLAFSISLPMENLNPVKPVTPIFSFGIPD